MLTNTWQSAVVSFQKDTLGHILQTNTQICVSTTGTKVNRTNVCCSQNNLGVRVKHSEEEIIQGLVSSPQIGGISCSGKNGGKALSNLPHIQTEKGKC